MKYKNVIIINVDIYNHYSFKYDVLVYAKYDYV